MPRSPEDDLLLPGLAVVEAARVRDQLVTVGEDLPEGGGVEVDVSPLHEARHAEAVADQERAPDDVERPRVVVDVVADLAARVAAAPGTPLAVAGLLLEEVL